MNRFLEEMEYGRRRKVFYTQTSIPLLFRLTIHGDENGLIVLIYLVSSFHFTTDVVIFVNRIDLPH